MGIANKEYEDQLLPLLKVAKEKLLFTTLMAIDYIKRMDECGYIVRYLSTDKEDNAIGNPFSSCFLLANNLIDNEVYTSVGYDIFRLPCGNNPKDVNHEIVKLQGDIFHAL